MVPERWADIVRPMGFEVVQCGYLGRFKFWIGTENWNKFKSALMLAAKWLAPLTNLLPAASRAYAPYCGLVARRRGGLTPSSS
jgi:hypothetical protein